MQSYTPIEQSVQTDAFAKCVSLRWLDLVNDELGEINARLPIVNVSVATSEFLITWIRSFHELFRSIRLWL